MAVHVVLDAGHRPHVYVTVGGGDPIQVATAVSVEPTTASPRMTGPYVKAGFVAPLATDGNHPAIADATATSSTGRRSRLRANGSNRIPPPLVAAS
jgi:hypothetical protein